MRAAAIMALAVAGVTAPAAAQGFGIYEESACAMARGGAVVAHRCGDGSEIFYNPSALFGHHGFVISGGATIIDVKGSFTADATGQSTALANDPIPVPHLFIEHGHSDRVSFGLGAYVPFGLATKWPTTFEGRFAGYDNSLQTIYIQPTIAYKVSDRLQIGAGLIIADGSVRLNQYVDLSDSPVPGEPITFGALGVPYHTAFATALLDAKGAIGFGGNFGVTLKPTDAITLGARYTTQVKLDYTGTATFTPVSTGITLPAGNPFGAPAGIALDTVVKTAFAAGGPLVPQAVTTTIRMPDQLVLGLDVAFSPAFSLEADYQWTRWSVFDTLPVNFAIAPSRAVVESYQNTHGVRVGGTWTASDKVSFRGGWDHHGGAAPLQTVTPLLPEGQRNEFTAGLDWRPSMQWGFAVAYQYIRQDDTRGRVVEAPPGVDPLTLNSGLYHLYANLVSATVTLHLMSGGDQ